MNIKKKIVGGILVAGGVLIVISNTKNHSLSQVSIEQNNYQLKNMDKIAIKIENDSGNYESTETIPTSGYTLSSDSYCNVDGTKDESIKITYENGKVGVSEITKKTKCYLYFEKGVSTAIGKLEVKEEKTEFMGIATAADTGIYSAPDDYGTSYYFRGLEGNLNNWVKFAGSYWRIIRVNGNGTIRMIYSGAANGNVSNSNKTGTITSIGSSSYNSINDDNTYIGYMKSLNDKGNTTSYSQAHSNLYDSNAKIEIDKWYKTNIEDEGLSKYIDTNTGFCNDRQTTSGVHYSYGTLGYGTNNTSYAPFGRLYQQSGWKETQTPTFQCENKTQDLFTANTSNIGNKKLTYPVGIITIDEAVFAGGFGGIENTSYYLYTNQSYWTMSPANYGNTTIVFFVNAKGIISNYQPVSSGFGLRPVINLRADTTFTGEGSETSPFEVVVS